MQIMLGGTVLALPDSLRGPLEDLATKVNSVEGPTWEEYFKKMLRKELIVYSSEMAIGRVVVEPELQPILRFLDTITLPARATNFFPGRSYVVNTKPGPHVKLGYIDPDLIRWFGDKAEEPTAETTLRRYVLARPSMFAPAMQEVRDSGFITKTTPGGLYSLLEKQPDGPNSPAGPLLTNGYTNLFEMDDKDGVARLVRARWNGDHGGWFVSAHAASHSYRWYDARQLFSGSSRLPSTT